MGHIESVAKQECTDSDNYYSCIFAVITLKACTPSLANTIHHQIGANICLLNDGILVWTTMAHLIFWHNTVFNKVIHAHPAKLTLKSCNNDFIVFAHQLDKFAGRILKLPK